MKKTLCFYAFLLAIFCSHANAQEYPTQIIKLVVSVPAGGLQDSLARSLAKYMGDTLGQPVIVENRPGANTIIAAQFVAKAPPDGYTLLVATDSTMSINPHLYAKLPYDPQRDFVSITQLVQLTEALFVSGEVPVRTLKEYVEYIRARPEGANFGSFGVGSNAHLAGQEFARITATKQTHVPFKGGADAMPALASNQVQSLITASAVAMPMVKAGKAKILAIAGPNRLAGIPEVPTFAESGYPGFVSSAWFGLVAPTGTPSPVIQKLAGVASSYLKTQDFREKFGSPYSIEPIGSSPDAFATFMRNDRVRYEKIVMGAGAKLE
ncbi:MAG: tripartite tricarboxylate transporter substrate binding protein [Pseudomonadota bacterium]